MTPGRTIVANGYVKLFISANPPGKRNQVIKIGIVILNVISFIWIIILVVLFSIIGKDCMLFPVIAGYLVKVLVVTR